MYFWMTGALQIINTTCTFMNPILLNVLVSWINAPEEGTILPPSPAVPRTRSKASNSRRLSRSC